MTTPQTEQAQEIQPKQKRKYTVDPNNKPGPTPAIERLYKTAEAFDKKVAAYFNGGAYKRKIILQDGVEVEIPTPTICDLVLFLGFVNRKSFFDYETHPLFGDSIKRARTLIEREYEMLLRSQYYGGAIFALKNFGWHDRTEIETVEHKTLHIEFEKLQPAELTAEVNRVQTELAGIAGLRPKIN